MGRELDPDYHKKHYQKNRVIYLKRAIKYRSANIEKCRQYSKDYYRKKPEKVKKSIAKHFQKLRLKIIDHYTKGQRKCMCPGCDIDILEFLQIDHINNDGDADRKRFGRGPAFYYYIIKNNFPKKYQILCMNCNLGRGRSKNKICPHVQNLI